MAHSEETKAAVMAALLEGQSIKGAARQYSLPESTVRDWKRETQSGKNEPKKARIERLLFSYLEENLETLRVQVRVFRDEEWLKKQEASQAAVLHGVLTDKCVRLLEALQAGSDQGSGPEGEARTEP